MGKEEEVSHGGTEPRRRRRNEQAETANPLCLGALVVQLPSLVYHKDTKTPRMRRTKRVARTFARSPAFRRSSSRPPRHVNAELRTGCVPRRQAVARAVARRGDLACLPQGRNPFRVGASGGVANLPPASQSVGIFPGGAGFQARHALEPANGKSAVESAAPWAKGCAKRAFPGARASSPHGPWASAQQPAPRKGRLDRSGPRDAPDEPAHARRRRTKPSKPTPASNAAVGSGTYTRPVDL